MYGAECCWRCAEEQLTRFPMRSKRYVNRACLTNKSPARFSVRLKSYPESKDGRPSLRSGASGQALEITPNLRHADHRDTSLFNCTLNADPHLVARPQRAHGLMVDDWLAIAYYFDDGRRIVGSHERHSGKSENKLVLREFDLLASL